ncbi:MAG: ABC transporter ATP-binding protein [Actinomycetota bacterium]
MAFALGACSGKRDGVISFDSVTYRYPKTDEDALSDVNLVAERGELLLVAGSSGAGKSTLLRCANGLVPHFTGGSFRGVVLANGRDTRSSKPRDLADVVGFVGQDPESSSVTATVEDEIAFVLENLGLSSSLMRKRVEETLDALAIASLRDRKLDTLSGGERQRVAIASVLVAAPSFVVLDEPTSQLDPQSAEEVLQTVLRMSHELGLGVMLAEHRLERVLAMADRLCVVRDARVEAGPVSEMIVKSPVAPPVVRLAQRLGWERAPLSVREARVMSEGLRLRPCPAVSPVPGSERIRAENLRVALDGREVLRASISVAQGETVAIVGRNGAGKTTLLRSVMGLIRPASGRVLLNGSVRRSVREAASVAAYVPQQAGRILCLPTVRREIESTLKLRKLPRSKTDEILSEWNLSWASDRDPRDLSGGEATRLAIAIAAAEAPEIVLLDEPTRGMDEELKHWLGALLEKWRADGKAVVIVTHDVELIAQVATRVALMSAGEIILDGPVREVLGESTLFSSQMNKVFGDSRIATVDDVIEALES